MKILRILCLSLLLTLTGTLFYQQALSKTWTVGFLTGSGGLGDESFNDMTYKGLGEAMKDYDIEVVVREWEPNRSMDVLMNELLATEPELIILNGNQFDSLINTFAPLHPEVIFIANDFLAREHPNVKSIVYSQHEGSFLAGALAGCFTQTGRIGFIGAVDIPVVKAFHTGFTEGVRYVSDTAAVTTRYISTLPDYTGFNNPKEGFAVAMELYNSGVDIIFAVSGSSGNGIIQAAKVSGKYVIGIDSNQDHMAKGHVLTSVMKRLDKAVFRETVNAYLGILEPGTAWYGLANGGISLTPMEFTRDFIAPEVLDKLTDLEKKIIAGEIAVTNSLHQNN